MQHLKKHILFVFLLLSFCIRAQESTRNTASDEKNVGLKILLIPFEPNLYMDECGINAKINQQTKWSFNQIRENFRHQLDNHIKLKLQSTGTVISFYSDSLKMAKDLDYIYKSTNVSYDLVEKPTDATAVAEKKRDVKNGQIIVEMNTDKKFMNTKINNPELLSYLMKKYKTDYFIFINELDIKSDMNSYDIATDSYQRELAVHYSILDKSGKTISAGIANSSFSSKENNPKKIASHGFSLVATTIAAKLETIVNPKPIVAPKK